MSAIGAMLSGCCQFKHHLLLAWFKEKTSRKEQKMVGGWLVVQTRTSTYRYVRSQTATHFYRTDRINPQQ